MVLLFTTETSTMHITPIWPALLELKNENNTAAQQPK